MKHLIAFSHTQKVCALGQGIWQMGDIPSKRKEEIKALQRGLDLGLTVIDTAEMYGNGRAEELVGEAIEGKRENVFLVSKVLPSNASRPGVKAACERSLKRLKTDWIDLYLLHWASAYPFEETLAGMMDLMAAGKIRQWGVSNMNLSDMKSIFSLPEGKDCATNQVLYNLSRRGIEYDLMPWCEEHQMPLMAYSPVEQGRLLSDENLLAMAQKYGATPSQIALAWVLRKPNILAIPKAGRIAHVEENAESLNIELSDEDLFLLDRLFPAPDYPTPLEML